MELLREYAMTTSKYGLILLSAAIIVRCIRSMLSERYEPELWGYLTRGRERLPIYHWENLIGRSRFSDVRVDMPGIGRVHAVLARSDRGAWRLYDIFSKGGVWVNGVKVGANGAEVRNGDVVNLGGNVLHFLPVNTEQRAALEQRRTRAGQTVSPAVTLIELTLFQLFLLIEHLCSAQPQHVRDIALAFAGLACLQWLCYYAMRFIDRTGFEVEALAFYLSTLGMSVAASSTPEDMYKQLLLTMAGVALFLADGWWLRNLRRTAALRIPVAVLAVALLGVNMVTSDAVFGARNWLEFGGYSFQPSEFVKALYIYAGASTLDRLYRTRNLYYFIGFPPCAWSRSPSSATSARRLYSS